MHVKENVRSNTQVGSGEAIVVGRQALAEVAQVVCVAQQTVNKCKELLATGGTEALRALGNRCRSETLKNHSWTDSEYRLTDILLTCASDSFMDWKILVHKQTGFKTTSDPFHQYSLGIRAVSM